MPFSIVRNNIVTMQVDAIVNAANSQLKAGGGVCGMIFQVAGLEELQKECDKIGYCATGEAVLTKGYHLRASYIIHTVGPIWRGGFQGEEAFLRNCYRNSLKLAAKKGIKSIAFPLISSGIYGYPKEQALQIAIEEIKLFLEQYHDDMDVILVIFDRKTFQIGQKRQLKIQEYIDDRYVEPLEGRWARQRLEKYCYETKMILPQEEKSYDERCDISESHLEENQMRILPKMERPIRASVSRTEKKSSSIGGFFRKKASQKSLEECLSKIEETFSQRLIRMIDERGMKDPDVYKKANIDRKHFNKIKNNIDYVPKKITVIAFAIALELNLDDAKDLLASAGYTLSRSNKFDIIIEYYLENEIYDIFEINEVLFAFEQPILN